MEQQLTDEQLATAVAGLVQASEQLNTRMGDDFCKVLFLENGTSVNLSLGGTVVQHNDITQVFDVVLAHTCLSFMLAGVVTAMSLK